MFSFVGSHHNAWVTETSLNSLLDVTCCICAAIIVPATIAALVSDKAKRPFKTYINMKYMLCIFIIEPFGSTNINSWQIYTICLLEYFKMKYLLVSPIWTCISFFFITNSRQAAANKLQVAHNWKYLLLQWNNI